MTSRELRLPPVGPQKTRSVRHHSGMAEAFLLPLFNWWILGKGHLVSSVIYPWSHQAPADNSKLMVTLLALIKLGGSQSITKRPIQEALTGTGRVTGMGGI